MGIHAFGAIRIADDSSELFVEGFMTCDFKPVSAIHVAVISLERPDMRLQGSVPSKAIGRGVWPRSLTNEPATYESFTAGDARFALDDLVVLAGHAEHNDPTMPQPFLWSAVFHITSAQDLTPSGEVDLAKLLGLAPAPPAEATP